jgi:hypothetical protein
MNTCRICSKPLEQPARGRRRTYCGIPCRRKAENAARRLSVARYNAADWERLAALAERLEWSCAANYRRYAENAARFVAELEEIAGRSIVVDTS